MPLPQMPHVLSVLAVSLLDSCIVSSAPPPSKTNPLLHKSQTEMCSHLALATHTPAAVYMATAQSAHLNPIPPSPYAEVIALLDSCFSIPAENPWVSRFLFTPHTVNVPEVPSEIHNAYALVAHVFQLPHDYLSSERSALIPLFTKDSITLGLQVRVKGAALDGAGTDQGRITYARFAFDNRDTSLISVDQRISGRDLLVSHMSHHVRSGRFLTFFQFQAQTFCSLVQSGSLSSSRLLNSLLRYVFIEELRDLCLICNKLNTMTCSCALPTGLPKHPMDFSLFAHNFTLYSGHFTSTKIVWSRSPANVLIKQEPMQVECEIVVSLGAEMVRDMCQLLTTTTSSGVRAGVAGVHTEQSQQGASGPSLAPVRNASVSVPSVSFSAATSNTLPTASSMCMDDREGRGNT
eukprot:GFKZ01014893.1.p1 GENE.GFKZ01014893.1~~GFKZ01014893.1.p1  ORF type:complete len:406 (+),score=17.29 GFKZ01014893.1:638-1855(+)